MALFRILRITAPTFLQRRLSISITRACAAAGGQHGDQSATIEFLKNSCGLSADAATAAAKKTQLKTTANAEAVIALLVHRGFSKPQISRLVASLPRLLVANPEKTIRPKLDFFRTLGLSDGAVPKLFLAESRLFFYSVDNKIAPNVDFLRSVLGDERKVLQSIREYPRMLTKDIPAKLRPRIQALKDYGVRESAISMLLVTSPGVVFWAPIQKTLEFLKQMGIVPSSWVFMYAFKVLNELSKTTWERKMALFQSIGWSEEQVLYAFGRHPYCMAYSDEKIRKKAEFFMQKLKWGPEKLYMYPILFSFSLEKRILPRCAVLDILALQGLVKAGVTVSSLILGDKAFRRMYVAKYEKKVPQLVDAMEGSKIDAAII